MVDRRRSIGRAYTKIEILGEPDQPYEVYFCNHLKNEIRYLLIVAVALLLLVIKRVFLYLY